MPNDQQILIIYATNSGNTYFVAERVRERLEQYGFCVTIKAVADAQLKDLSGHDLIILGSCTWNRKTALAKVEEGQLQDQMDTFVNEIPEGAGKGVKFAVFGLGDKDYQHFCRAADCLEDFVARVGGEKVWPSMRVNGFPQGQEESIDEWTKHLVKRLKYH